MKNFNDLLKRNFRKLLFATFLFASLGYGQAQDCDFEFINNPSAYIKSSGGTTTIYALSIRNTGLLATSFTVNSTFESGSESELTTSLSNTYDGTYTNSINSGSIPPQGIYTFYLKLVVPKGTPSNTTNVTNVTVNNNNCSVTQQITTIIANNNDAQNLIFAYKSALSDPVDAKGELKYKIYISNGGEAISAVTLVENFPTYTNSVVLNEVKLNGTEIFTPNNNYPMFPTLYINNPYNFTFPTLNPGLTELLVTIRFDDNALITAGDLYNNNNYTIINNLSLTYSTSSNIKPYSVTTKVYPNYWIGTESTDWNTATNWTYGIPPNSTDNVTFATAANYYTTDYQSGAVKDLLLDQDRSIGNLTNESTRALIIPTGKTLTVGGKATVNSPDRILIQSAVNVANGSLIFTNPPTNDVLATVEMYSKAYKGATQTFTGPNNVPYTVSYRWQYFGIPVKDAVYNTVFEATAPVSYVRISDETKNGNTTYYDEWTQLYNTDVLNAFKGYEITQNVSPGSGKLITFKGPLVTGNQTLNLTYTSNSLPESYGSGYNIFGNSFTAAIDINKIQFGSAVDKTVYLYNTGSLYDWYEATANTESSGSYLAISQETSSVIQREIPSMQGFMLIANSGFSGTNDYKVILPYNTILNNTLAQRAPSAGNTGFSYLTADVVGKSGGDRVWLFSQPETSRKYDNGWDGRKIILNPGFSLYVDEGKDQLQVSTSDNLDKTYLAFRAGKDTEYTLKINKTNLTDYQTLYLTDLETKTVVDLSALNEYSYAFTASNTAKAERRFLITSKDKKENLKTQKVKIFNTNNIVRIDNPTDESGTVQLFDMYGQLRYTSVFDASGVTEINTMLPASVYVVRVKSAGIDQSGKIVISR